MEPVREHGGSEGMGPVMELSGDGGGHPAMTAPRVRVHFSSWHNTTARQWS
jgi:hypothetical protein